MHPFHKPDSTVTALRGFDLFHLCSDRELRALAQLTTPVSFNEGDVLCQQGAPGRQAFILTSGTARIDIDGQPVDTVGAGTLIGEIALLTYAQRTATVTATSPVTALVLSTAEFRSMIHDAPTATRAMLGHLAARLRTSNSLLANAGH
jgi:CRP-like cAMP-binding protein